MGLIAALKNWSGKARAMGLARAWPRLRPSGWAGLFVSYDANDFKNDGQLSGLICCIGKNNIVIIKKGSRFSGSLRIEGSDNLVEIGESCTLKSEILVKGHHQKVVIGDRTRSFGLRIVCQEGCDVLIGRDCLFSRQVEVRTSDAHGIYDRVTGERVNPSADVKIDAHVWVGVGAIISKGAHIPADSVVGAQSFVNKDFSGEIGVVLAGHPAKVVRSGINWTVKAEERASPAQLRDWQSGK